MAQHTVQVFSSSGVQPIAVDPQQAGPNGYLLTFTPSSDWSGYLTLGQDRNAPGVVHDTPTAAQLTATAWTSYTRLLADPFCPTDGTGPLQTTAQIVVGTPTYPLYGNVVWTAGQLTVRVLPYTAVDTKGLTANWSGITIDSIPPNYDDAFELVAALQDAGNLTDA